ncbi:MAG: hypothetical protein HJJLKODD_02736 [Phycisphaerae bacterium]|nr:hypothetical protein [Phycisphaerae bacterium]
MAIYYPDDHCAVSSGCAIDPRPVLAIYRGGNANPTAEQLLTSKQTVIVQELLSREFIVAMVNYPVLELGDDPTTATAAVGYSIQYLRAHSAELNIEPEAVMALGRSHGGLRSLENALRFDYQQPHAADPILHESSIPNALVVRSAVTHLPCIDAEQFDSELVKILIGDLTVMSETEKFRRSATSWLLYMERPYTPPMLLAYSLDDSTTAPCGEIIDPHDGTFGLVFWRYLKIYARQKNQSELLAKCGLLDFSAQSEAETAVLIADWLEARLQDP